MSQILKNILKFFGPFQLKQNYKKLDWIVSGLSIFIIVLCLFGLLFWQVKEHRQHHSDASYQTPFNPASNK